MKGRLMLGLLVCLGVAACRMNAASAVPPGSIGSRVFVVERNSETLAVYDLDLRRIVHRVSGLGNLQHATMTFSRDLRYGFVASRSGKLTRIDLATLERAGEVQTSNNSIDIAISQDGRYVATAEYFPGGVTILDTQTLEVVHRIPATGQTGGRPSGQGGPDDPNIRVTGIVDAPGNRFVCTLIETGEIWVIDASRPDFPVERRVPVGPGEPYDAMITPDGRTYVVGLLDADEVAILDLRNPERGTRRVSLREPGRTYDRSVPVKLPHLASWAVARNRIFVPLVGEERLAVLDRDTWQFVRSIPLRGNPVYAVRSPGEREVWVSFSGLKDDAFVQVVDVDSLEITHTLRVGGRIYHMDFTPRGSHVLVTANRDDKLVLVNAATYAIENEEPVRSPSGVFGVWRAFVIGL